jgi:hypothetical protein
MQTNLENAAPSLLSIDVRGSHGKDVTPFAPFRLQDDDALYNVSFQKHTASPTSEASSILLSDSDGDVEPDQEPCI